MMRAAAKAVIVSRCVRGIDRRGLHVTNLDALRSALLGVARDGVHLPGRRLRGAALRLRAEAVVGGDCHQRRDRRRVGAREGHQRPLHAPRRRAPSAAGTSRPTSATRRRSTAPRSPSTASRRCTGCRSTRSHTSSSLSAERHQNASSRCSIAEQDAAARRPPRRSRRSGGPAGAAAASRSSTRATRAPSPGAGAASVARSHRAARPAPRASRPRASSPRRRRGSGRRPRRGRAPRSGCGSSARARVAGTLEVLGGETLAELPEGATRVGGAWSWGDRTEGRVTAQDRSATTSRRVRDKLVTAAIVTSLSRAVREQLTCFAALLHRAA